MSDATFMCRCEYSGKDKWKHDLLESAKPILFNTEMVRAILDGRKTVTRRVVKPQPVEVTTPNGVSYLKWKAKEFFNNSLAKYGPYRTGQVLYVRETWQTIGNRYIYKADVQNTLTDDIAYKLLGWRPSIHMPREAARIFLRVTDVQVERLRDITEEQAISEGCSGVFIGNGETLGSGWEVTPTDEFSKLWNSTIKPADRELYGWDASPWVWVIEFERCEKPEGG